MGIRISLIGLLALGIGELASAQEPRILLETGRDYPETRLFSACQIDGDPGSSPQLAVAGFSRAGQHDLADVAAYDFAGESLTLRWRVLRGGPESSSIRTLRAADLDADGRQELIALGRNGDEHVDSRGELQVFRRRDEQWQLVDLARWQSGRYTHGYGMDVADLDGDGIIEIVSGGFFLPNDGGEQGELRVWHLVDGKLTGLAETHWGSEAGNTRVNAVCVGDVTGDGRLEIVTAGRAGQIKTDTSGTTAEADELIVWTFDESRLTRMAEFTNSPEARNRFRALTLADIDGKPGSELIAAGSRELQRPRGDGSGGGRGAGSGGGRSNGSGRGTGGRGAGTGPRKPAMRPAMIVLQIQGGELKMVGNADFADALGEVRDVAVLRDAGGASHVLTISASEFEPERQTRLDVWQSDGLSLTRAGGRTAQLADDTRAREFVIWSKPASRQVLTIGFVHRGEQILGQILDWGPAETLTEPADP